MKKKWIVALFLGVLAFNSCKYDDQELWDSVHNLDDRLTKVEQMLSDLNKDVNSMHSILTEIQSRPSITDYQLIDGGMIISFSDGQKITIKDGLTPTIGTNGNWWIGGEDTGVKAIGETPYIGQNGNWWINGQDTGERAVAKDGETPYIVDGYWWINDVNTGVKAVGTDGLTPTIGDNGNWWIGGKDTGVKAIGETPYIGQNGNWWIGTSDTGVKAEASDGLTPHIGNNGNWWIGNTDTGVKADGNTDPQENTVIGVEKGNDGIYYWTVTIDGVKDFIYDDHGNKISCSGVQPIFRTDYNNNLQYSINYGVTWIYVLDINGNHVSLGSGQCPCTHFFTNVYVQNGYLHLVLTDGTLVRIKIEGGSNRGDIPADPTVPSPDVQNPNISIPNPSGVIEKVDEWGNIVYNITLSGVSDVDGNWLKLFGTGNSTQNIWLDVDGEPKGILVINLEDNVSRVKNDIIFSIDNSGSMSEESDAVARDIMDLTSYLEGKGLDVQFAVAGYDGGITGARNICSAAELNTYLKSNGTGTDRTYHFGGSDASTLKSAASNYNNSYYECGAAAIQYANNNFDFRVGSNRIYINFTDEPNQPNGKSQWSVNFFKSQSNWPAQYGTIHSVYSSTSTTYTESINYKEYPWRMAEYTGGTKMFTSSSFTGVNLKDIPVMDAISHSYTIKLIIPQSLLDGLPHTVVIKIITSDGKTRGILTLTNFVFGMHK